MERGQKVGSDGSANGSLDNLNNPLLFPQSVVATSLSLVPEAVPVGQELQQANATRVPDTNARRKPSNRPEDCYGDLSVAGGTRVSVEFH